MYTLCGSLRPLGPHLPPVLVSPEALTRILAVAESLPATLSSAFGFECRLGAEAAPAADFALYTPLSIGGPLLAGTDTASALSPRLLEHAAWQGLRALAERWVEDSSELHAQVAGVWLEFDVGDHVPHVPVPSVFISFDPNVDALQRTAESALALLRGSALPVSTSRQLSRCLAALPPQARVLHVGAMLARESQAVRLCLTGLAASDIPSYLTGLGWAGNPLELSELLKDFQPLVDTFYLSMDIDSTVLPRIGLECYLHPQSTQAQAQALLEHLVARSLCTPERREALLAWSGEQWARLPHHLWHSRISRVVSYFKLAYAPGRAPEAKAYFGAVLKPLVAEPPSPLPPLPRRPGPLSEQLPHAIQRALAFLAAHQLSHGEFRTYIADTPELGPQALFDSSPFVTTFVLQALGYCRGDGVERMRRAALGFLVEQMEAPGLWRYWSSRNQRHIDWDLDDTACASHALKRYHPHILAGTNVATLLAQRNERGLFHTWVRPPGARNDVDAAVNANVLLYLGQRPETEAACQYLIDTIRQGRERESCWYYLDDLSLHYMASRALRHGVTGLAPARPYMLERLLGRQREDGSFGSALDTALALCTLHNLGHTEPEPLARGTRWLLGQQLAEGCWPRLAFYTGPEPPHPRSVWFGSEELTTALCLEALARHPPTPHQE